MRARRASAQIAIERKGISGKGKARAEAEIGLINIARFDIGMGAGKPCAIFIAVPAMGQRPGIGAARRMFREPGIGPCPADVRHLLEHAEPQKRHSAARRHERRQLWFQRIAKLIGEIPRHMTPCGLLCGYGGKRTRHIFRRIGTDEARRALVHAQVMMAGAGIIQNHANGAGFIHLCLVPRPLPARKCRIFPRYYGHGGANKRSTP